MKRRMNAPESRRRFLAGSACGAATLAIAKPGHAVPRKRSEFHELRRISIQSNSPRRIAVDSDGGVWLAAGNLVQQLDSDGKQIWQMELSKPVRCLAVNDRSVFVGMRDHVLQFDRESRDSRPLPSIGEGHLIGDVAVAGNVVTVTDVTAGRVLCLDWGQADWEQDERNWAEVSGASDLLSSSGRIAPSSRGGLAITDPARHRIVMTDRAGNTLGAWGKRSRKIDGFQGCCNPMATAELSDGSWVTAEAGQVRIKRFDATGEFVTQIAGPDSIDSPAVLGEEDPSLNCGLGGIDLAVSADDDLWVLHAAAKQLIHYRAS